MTGKSHWEKVYTNKPAASVSWYQEHAERSLSLLHDTAITKSAAIIDVGGGASTLVVDLLAEGYTDVTVLDLSSAALSATKQRLGPLAAKAQWREADVTDPVGRCATVRLLLLPSGSFVDVCNTHIEQVALSRILAGGWMRNSRQSCLSC